MYIICLLVGLFIGVLIMWLADDSDEKQALIDDYKKGIEIHNKRELRLIFINQSTKDYVKQQLNIIKNKQNYKDNEEANLAAARYIAFKDIEKCINQLEKNSEDLNV